MSLLGRLKTYKREEKAIDGSKCYERGTEVLKDSVPKAAEWYRRGAEEFDHGNCQSALGKLYSKGLIGSKVNLGLAAYWLKKAISSDVSAFPEIYLILGLIYLVGGDEFEANEVEASKWIEKAAVYNPSCYKAIGDAYYKGNHFQFHEVKLPVTFEKDYEKSLVWYIKAAENLSKPDAPAEKIANIYLQGGYGVEKDYQKVLYWCEEFHGEDYESEECKRVTATVYKDGGYGVEKDIQKALQLCLDLSLWFEAADIYQFHIYPPDFQKAASYYEKAVDSYSYYEKDLHHVYYFLHHVRERLGLLNLKGLGVKKNLDLAKFYLIGDSTETKLTRRESLNMDYYRGDKFKDIEQDKASFTKSFRFDYNCYYEGVFHQYGFCTDVKYQRAYICYNKCDEKNFAYSKAMNQIGLLYRDGLGRSQDFKEAIRFFKLSAEKNCHDAFNSMGYMYKQGYGVDVDYEEAFKWYCKAAEEPTDNGGQFNLAVMYSEGKGTPVNYKLALHWFEKARNYGNENATEFVIAQTKMLMELLDKNSALEDQLRRIRGSDVHVNEQKELPKMFYVEDVIYRNRLR
ncbi:unnamed protein product [Mucor hiemalis]